MSFSTLSSLFSKFIAAQTIEPAGAGSAFGSLFAWLFTWVWEGICLGIYNLVRWLLAIVDFMQYFVQKLIGLDYWLNRTYYTLEGAMESDLIFGFLYNDTVQKVFRAMMGLFFVLLIIFTIYAIIKQEWTYITGKEFGNGSGNSKSKIFRSSIKAIALVLIFPIILMAGIVSANAILASLIKALNIDTSSTLGGQLFQIASQNAIKYEKYANGDGRNAVADDVTFYIYDGKWLCLSRSQGDEVVSTELVTSVNNYGKFLNLAAQSNKYTVNSVFQKIDPGLIGGNSTFTGYCARLTREGEPYFVMVACDEGEEEGMGYYLKNVLGVKVVSSIDSLGFEQAADFKNNINTEGLISNFDLWSIGSGAIARACYNTWNYASIYEEVVPFEDAEDYVTVNAATEVSIESSIIGNGTSEDSLLELLGLGDVTSAKLMINSDQISQYFDGGQQGIVQMQSEYLVMSEVVDFMCANNFRLYMLDITSGLIDWRGESGYQVESRWIGSDGSDRKISKIQDGKDEEKEVLPFVISYSDNCNETEMGNVLYFASKDDGNELHGAKYIMCIKVEGTGNSKYIPLVNNSTYTDPVTGAMYNFKSDYYTSNYHGVVLAKGIMDAGATNAYRGEPTYLVGGATNKKGDVVAEDKPYYFDMEIVGGFNQFVRDGGYQKETLTIENINIPLSSENVSYVAELDGSTNVQYKVFKVTTDEDGGEVRNEITPSDDIMLSMDINMISESGNAYYTAEWTGKSQNGYYLFQAGTSGLYFVVKVTPEGLVQVYSGADDNSSWTFAAQDAGECPVKAVSKAYEVKYDYVKTDVTPNVTIEDRNIFGDGSTKTVTPRYFEYVKTYKGKSVFSTVDMQTIDDIDKTLYMSVVFETSGSDLVSISYNGEEDKVSVNFASAYSAPASRGDRNNDQYIQRSQLTRFNLYNFYTASVGSLNNVNNRTLKQYDIKEGEVSSDAVEAPTDDEWYFECSIDSTGFSFPARESYIHLYNGKKYVATIYKVTGNDAGYAIDDISELAGGTTYILYNNQTYYNIDTQNVYADNDAMSDYYKKVSGSMVIICTRANRGYTFFDMDFAFVSLIPWKARLYMAFFNNNLEREWQGHQFYLNEGIHFDYFFEGEASLVTFYIPSKISYWIIIIASALMIKVLGTAIWGVIKRIYEITLYFLAAPAVASTIPLDDGQKFNSTIQQPLVRKVLSTYGVMLGINVFFILLYPVKSLSQVFTAEDIATSNSYFLKNFFSLFSFEFKAKVLNLYVYILFVLVAFTMISSLPQVISSMVGADDVVKMGNEAKSQAAKDVKGAMDIASGKTLMDKGKSAFGAVKESALGSPLAAAGRLGKKGYDKIRDRFNQGDGEGDGSGGTTENSHSKNDEDESDNPPTENDDETKEDENETPEEKQAKQEVQNAIDDKVKEATGGMTYEEALASGDPEKIKQAEEAKAAAEADIKENGTDAQKAALDKMNSQGEGDDNQEEKSPDETIEDTAKDEFESSIDSMSEAVGSSADTESMTAATVANGATQGNEAALQIAAQILAQLAGASPEAMQKGVKLGEETGMTQDMKADLVKSTMSAEDQQKFDNMSAEEQAAVLDQYSVTAQQDPETGKMGMVVTQLDENGNEDLATAKTVNEDVVNSTMGQMVANADKAEVASAVEGADEGVKGEITKFAAGNLAATINFGNMADDAVAQKLEADIIANPTEERNADVVNRAMLAALQANPESLAFFQQAEQLSDEDMQDTDKLLKIIDSARGNGATLSQYGIKSTDDYSSFVGQAMKESYEAGNYQVTAWELFKQDSSNEAQAYMADVALRNGLKTEEEIAFEQEQSKEQIGTDQMFQALANQGVDSATAQSMFTTYLGMDEAAVSTTLAEMGGETVKNLMLQQGLSAEEIAIAKQASVASGKTLDEVIALSKQNPDQYSSLLMTAMQEGKLNGNLDAVKSGLENGEFLSEDQQAKLTDSIASNGMLALNQGEQQQILEMMAGGADAYAALSEEEKAKLEETANGMSLYEINGMKQKYIENVAGGADAYAALSEEEKANLEQNATKTSLMDVDGNRQKLLEHLAGGADKYAALSEEEKADLDKQVDDLSANGKANAKIASILAQEVHSDTRAEITKNKVFDTAIASEEIGADQALKTLVEGGDSTADARVAFAEAYASRMDVIDEATKSEISRQARFEHIGGKAVLAGLDDEGKSELDEAKIAAAKDLVAGNKDLQKFQDQWLKANKGKATGADFYKKLMAGGFDAEFENSGNKGLQGLGSEIKGLREVTEQNFAIGYDKRQHEGDASYDIELDRVASEAIETENKKQIIAGFGGAAIEAVGELSQDNKFMRDVRNAYKEQFGADQNFDKLDEISKASFIYRNFGDRVKETKKYQEVSKQYEQTKASEREADLQDRAQQVLDVMQLDKSKGNKLYGATDRNAYADAYAQWRKTNKDQLTGDKEQDRVAFAKAIASGDFDIAGFMSKRKDGQRMSDERLQALMAVRTAPSRIQTSNPDNFNDQIFERLKTDGDGSALKQVYDDLESYDGGERGNAIVHGLKRQYLENLTGGDISKIDLVKDPETMSASDRKAYEFNRGILSTELRTNPELIGNVFKNKTILDQGTMIAQIAANMGDGFDISKKEELAELLKNNEELVAKAKAEAAATGAAEGSDKYKATYEEFFKKAADTASEDDIKRSLSNEAIANYMNTHEGTKEKLISLGAQDITSTLDDNSRQAKRVDAVLDNDHLRTEVTEQLLAEQTKGETISEDQMKKLIEEMLKNDDRAKTDAKGNTTVEGMNIDDYIRANMGELKTEIALRGLQKVGNFWSVQSVVSDESAKSRARFMSIVDEQYKQNEAFRTGVDKHMTRMIDPSTYDPDKGAQEFFKPQTLETFRAKTPQNMQEAMDAFENGNFEQKDEQPGKAVVTGGLKGGLKTILLGTAKEGSFKSGVMGNDRERGGVVGGLESIAVKGIAGSLSKALTLKSVRSGVKLFKGYDDYRRNGENKGVRGYLRMKAGITDNDTGWARFKKYSGKIADNTAVGSLLKNTSLGVAKIGSGIGLGVARATVGSFRDDNGRLKKGSVKKAALLGAGLVASTIMPLAAPLVATTVGSYVGGKTFLNHTKIGKRFKKGFQDEDGNFTAKSVSKKLVKYGVVGAGALTAGVLGGVPLLALAGGAAVGGKQFLNKTQIGRRFKNGLHNTLFDENGTIKKGGVAKVGLSALGISAAAVAGVVAPAAIPLMLSAGGVAKLGKNYVTKTGLNLAVKNNYRSQDGKLHIFKGTAKTVGSFVSESAIARGIKRDFRNNNSGRYTAASIMKGVGLTTLKAGPAAIAALLGGPVAVPIIAGAVSTAATTVMGNNGVVFKMTRKLPQQCAQYENWNRVINHKIEDIKKNKSMTRAQKEVEIRKFESQRIHYKKPDNFAQMTAQEQNAYSLMQDKLKREAFTDPNLLKYVRQTEVRVKPSQNPSAFGITDGLRFRDPTADSRHRHLDEYKQVQAMIRRYNATSAMRNRHQDFGDDFERMARSFLDRKRYFDMMKRYKIKSAIEYKNMTDAQKEKERRKREEALAAQIARLNRIVSRKIANDNKPSTFLVARGVVTENARFTDGSKRFRTTQSGITSAGISSVQNARTRSQESIISIQTQAMNIDKMMQHFVKFTSSYKGSSADFAREFKKQFAQYGPYAQKIYDRYASSLKRLGGAALGRSATLEGSPLAVQQREIMKGMVDALNKCKRQLDSRGMLPAGSAIRSLYTGKTMTGATTKAEVALHKQAAEDFRKALKLVQEQREMVSYSSLIRRISPALLEEFNKKSAKFASKSEVFKKNELEKFLQTRLDSALKRAHNSSVLKADMAQLTKLNGRYVKKSELSKSSSSSVMANAIKTSNLPVYSNIVREYNSAHEKVKLENLNLSMLAEQLRKMNAMPKTAANVAQIAKLNSSIKKAETNLDRLKKLLSTAESRKRDFERAFASSQIKEAKIGNKSLAFNATRSKTVERYDIRRTDGSRIEAHTTDAKQVEMLVSRYVQQYRQQMQAMMKSEILKTDTKLRTYVGGLSKKFSDDLGKSMAFTKSVRSDLAKQVSRLKESSIDQDKKIGRELEDYIKKIKKTEDQLAEDMRKMNIDIKSIKLSDK